MGKGIVKASCPYRKKEKKEKEIAQGWVSVLVLGGRKKGDERRGGFDHRIMSMTDGEEEAGIGEGEEEEEGQ